VYVPLKEEQEKIITILNAQDEHIATEEANLNKLTQVKKGLMHDLLTGRVSFTHLDSRNPVITGRKSSCG
jgi:restriction endonuclease S subunit